MIYLKQLVARRKSPSWDPSNASLALGFSVRMHSRSLNALVDEDDLRHAADIAASVLAHAHADRSLHANFLKQLLEYSHHAVQGRGYELESISGLDGLTDSGGRNIMLVIGCQSLQLMHSRVDEALRSLLALQGRFQVVFVGSNPSGGTFPSAVLHEAREMRAYFDSRLGSDAGKLGQRVKLEQWIEPETADTRGNVKQFLASKVLHGDDPKRIFLVSSTFHLMRVAAELEVQLSELIKRKVTSIVLIGSEAIYDEWLAHAKPEFIKSLAFEVYYDLLKADNRLRRRE